MPVTVDLSASSTKDSLPRFFFFFRGVRVIVRLFFSPAVYCAKVLGGGGSSFRRLSNDREVKRDRVLTNRYVNWRSGCGKGTGTIQLFERFSPEKGTNDSTV